LLHPRPAVPSGGWLRRGVFEWFFLGHGYFVFLLRFTSS
jgi:hypothetical protein